MLTTDKYLSTLELELLHKELQAIRLLSPRNALLIELTLATGVRESELVSIRVNDINHETKSIFIRTTKRGLNRDIPIFDQVLWNHLINYSNQCSGLLFDIDESRVRQIWYESRPKQIKKSFHKLRHTFGRINRAKGADIWLLKYLLGHKNIANTAIYTETEYTPESIRKALNG
jgi:site-specific recombinase XerD